VQNQNTALKCRATNIMPLRGKTAAAVPPQFVNLLASPGTKPAGLKWEAGLETGAAWPHRESDSYWEMV
jgi:hypothetical protein